MALKIEMSPCVTEGCFCRIPLWLYMETESFSTSSSQLLSCGIFSITAVLHFINTIKRQNSCITLSIRRRLHLHWGRKFIHLKSPHLQRGWMKTHPKRDPPLLFLIFLCCISFTSSVQNMQLAGNLLKLSFPQCRMKISTTQTVLILLGAGLD